MEATKASTSKGTQNENGASRPKNGQDGREAYGATGPAWVAKKIHDRCGKLLGRGLLARENISRASR